MKVIFLDFDGVLNSQASFIYENRQKKKGLLPGQVNKTLCNVCTSNFQTLLERFPEVKIVISSTWRLLFELDWLKAHLLSYNIEGDRVIDKTSNLARGFDSRGFRGREIKQWLEAHPEVTGYVILDDDSDMLAEQQNHFVKTTWLGGLTLDHVEKAADILHLKYEKPEEPK